MAVDTSERPDAYLLRTVNYLATHDREMSIPKLAVFLNVAKQGDDGALVREIMKDTGQTQSSVSRTLAHLGERLTRGQMMPLHWVEMKLDIEDPRRVRCFVTNRGKDVLADLEEIKRGTDLT